MGEQRETIGNHVKAMGKHGKTMGKQWENHGKTWKNSDQLINHQFFGPPDFFKQTKFTCLCGCSPVPGFIRCDGHEIQ